MMSCELDYSKMVRELDYCKMVHALYYCNVVREPDYSKMVRAAVCFLKLWEKRVEYSGRRARASQSHRKRAGPMTGMTGLHGEPYYSKMVHRVLSAPSYGKTTGDAPWRGLDASSYFVHRKMFQSSECSQFLKPRSHIDHRRGFVTLMLAPIQPLY